MTDTDVGRAWTRVLEGRHAAVVGQAFPQPPIDRRELLLMSVDCELLTHPLGPMLDMRDRISRLMADGTPDLLEAAAGALKERLRRRLLGDVPEQGRGAGFVRTFNRLRELSGQRAVLCFQGVDSADAGTLSQLAEMLGRADGLRVPVLLTFRSQQPRGDAAELLEVLREREGDEAIVRLGADAHAEAPQPRQVDTQRLDDLPRDVLEALRAASIPGPAADARAVAALLEISPLEVLLRFQRAADAGVPLEDRDDGRVVLPREWNDALRATSLPSLRSAWHARLAEILRVPQEPSAARQPSEPAPPHAAEAPQRPKRKPVTEQQDLATAASRTSDAQHAMRAMAMETASVSRAAEHAEAAGELDLAAEQHIHAASQAAGLGAPEQAISFLDKADALIARQAPSEARRVLRVRRQVELARVQWLAAGPGEAFSLGEAMRSAEQARSMVTRHDPADLRARVASVVAHIAYDMGDPEEMQRALLQLTETSRALLQDEEAVRAACLLNDEAALWVRLGDPMRGNHLLERSYEIFQRFAAHDEEAQLELAETTHLRARLMLHVRARQGRERDALGWGLEQARSAESLYREMDQPRELARVWETMGRLEQLLGHTQRAATHLSEAANAQQRMGDVIGLARSTAGLADLLAETGEVEKTLQALADSVALNVEKGSPVGLAFNRATLERLRDQLPGDQQTGVERLLEHLARAERTLGRVPVPPEPLQETSSQASS